MFFVLLQVLAALVFLVMPWFFLRHNHHMTKVVFIGSGLLWLIPGFFMFLYVKCRLDAEIDNACSVLGFVTELHVLFALAVSLLIFLSAAFALAFSPKNVTNPIDKPDR